MHDAQGHEQDQQLIRRTLLKLTATAGLAPFVGSLGACATPAATRGPAAFAGGGRTHTVKPSRETVRVGQMDPAAPAAVVIRTGDTVHYDGTWTQWGNEARYGMSFDEREPIRKKYPAGPYSLIGPVEIEGARPGDVVECRMLTLRTIDWGWNSSPLGVGALPTDFSKPYLRYLRFNAARTAAEFVPGVMIPLAPFQGVFAVEPPGDKPTSGILAGTYGGNLDLPELVAGTSLFLPVQVPGARIWTGDSNAAQGDGVVNQTAIETALEELRVQYLLHAGVSLDGPMVETPTHWIGIGFGESLEAALVACVRQMIRWMSRSTSIAPEDCYGILSVAASFRITQYSNQTGTVYRSVPPKGVHCMLPKTLFSEDLLRRLGQSLRGNLHTG
ncbi:acetamidase/formamidase family protein [Noviherbaspirillum denitrificans]|uniref:Acetamidase n=1 Tax=Noviherbaspirillum denitrificans TaxID=1968433 RepID=A0A254TDH7_9BURK|nr:acetamidase/formamidase family protein [Noviherbaspirillum denitrificans]OWW20605.1 acetamidase [Noviherbaspirillum denitrificans]